MKRQKMRTEQKSNVKNSVGRLVFVGLSLLLQVLWILLLFLRLNAYSTAISLCFSVGAFLVALSIYAQHRKRQNQNDPGHFKRSVLVLGVYA